MSSVAPISSGTVGWLRTTESGIDARWCPVLHSNRRFREGRLLALTQIVWTVWQGGEPKHSGDGARRML